MSAAIIAPKARQASTGRSAGWVVRLDSPECCAADAGSALQRIGTGARRINDPFAARPWSTSAASGIATPVVANRLIAAVVVVPMSKHSPVEDQ
ncbi:MAG: hypothetical protein V9E94_04380 [Microthrixaceae bacterium]